MGKGRRWRWKGRGGGRQCPWIGGRATRTAARRDVEGMGEGEGEWRWMEKGRDGSGRGCRRTAAAVAGEAGAWPPVPALTAPVRCCLSIARSSVAVHAFCPTARERDREREREGRGREEEGKRRYRTMLTPGRPPSPLPTARSASTAGHQAPLPISLILLSSRCGEALPSPAARCWTPPPPASSSAPSRDDAGRPSSLRLRLHHPPPEFSLPPPLVARALLPLPATRASEKERERESRGIG